VGNPCFYCGVGTAQQERSTFFVTTGGNWGDREPESHLIQTTFRLCEVCGHLEKTDINMRRELSTLAAARSPNDWRGPGWGGC